MPVIFCFQDCDVPTFLHCNSQNNPYNVLLKLPLDAYTVAHRINKHLQRPHIVGNEVDTSQAVQACVTTYKRWSALMCLTIL